MIDDGYLTFLSCLGVLGLGDATVYLHALGFHEMDLITSVNETLQLSFDSECAVCGDRIILPGRQN